MTFSEPPAPQPTQPPVAWTPPVDAGPPAGGWGNNAIAVRARSLLFTDLVIIGAGLLCSVAAFVPDPTVQTYAILALWVVLLAASIIAVIVIVFASIGLYRASRLGGYRRGTALAALLGGIAVLFAPAVFAALAAAASFMRN